MEQKTDGFEQWYYPVGKLIVSFGNIEFFTYRLWEHVFPEVEVPVEFKKIVNKLIGKLREHDGLSATVMISLLQQCHDLYDKRNIIAHNPATLNLFVDQKTDKFHSSIQISPQKSFKKKKQLQSISYQELLDLVSQVDDLCRQFANSAMSFLGSNS